MASKPKSTDKAPSKAAKAAINKHIEDEYEVLRAATNPFHYLLVQIVSLKALVHELEESFKKLKP